MARARKYARAAELLPLLAYEPNHQLFFLEEDDTGRHMLGFAFACRPLTGGDERTFARLSALLQDNFPDGSFVQISLIGSPNLMPQLQAARILRGRTPDPVLRAAVEEHLRFLAVGVDRPIEAATRARVRDFQLIVAVKCPIGRGMPGETAMAEHIRQLDALRASVRQNLRSASLAPVDVDAGQLLSLFSVLLNRGPQASWRQEGRLEPVDDRPLRDQVLDYDTTLAVHARGLRLGETEVRVLSTKVFPPRITFGTAAYYVGDLLTGARGLRTTFLLTQTLHYPPRNRIRGKLESKRQMNNHTAFGPLARWQPKILATKQDYDHLFDALEEGARLVTMNMTLALFAADEKEAEEAVASAQNYWQELSFQLLPDRFFTLPLFLQALPLCVEARTMADLQRFKTTTTHHAACLAPVFAEWAGTKTPSLHLIGRNGQLMQFCLYDSGTNYNLLVCAQSGAGKSFLTQEMILSYLSQGARVWVIDKGRSYMNLCRTLNGQWIAFDRESEICLNPFPAVVDIDDEQDALVGLLTAMAAPNQPLTDLQLARLTEILRNLWDEHTHALTIDRITEVMKQDADERIRDVGHQLYNFTSQGAYGRYFVGANKVDLASNFIVLEMDDLSSRRHLQQVVVLQLMHQISTAMYHGDRAQKKIVLVDEAWDLLGEGDASRFLEEYYRRVRKYGGAAGIITQSIADVYASANGRAIVDNSANLFLLAQKAETIDQLAQENRLPFGEGEVELFKSVHTIPGAYSEIMIASGAGRGIARLIVDPYRQLLFSTRPQDVADLARHTGRGLTTAAAIKAVLAERAAASFGGADAA